MRLTQRFLSTFLTGTVLLTGLTVLSLSSVQAAPKPSVASSVPIIGADAASPDVVEVLTIVGDLMNASNKHDLDGVMKHYSPRFISGDGLTLEQVRHLIEDTWKTYSDIYYESKPLEVRMNGDWATVESVDVAHAKAKADNLISSEPGLMESRSRGLLFLRKVGKSWEIVGDQTLYEKALIVFGTAKTIKLDVSVPDQAFADEPYSAKLEAEVPNGTFAIVSITKDPIVYPQRSGDDKFRTLSQRKTSLERVFKANDTHNNEMVTMTIGLTEVSQETDQDRPSVKFSGMATVVKRVNIQPKPLFQTAESLRELTQTSSSGKIDLSKGSGPLGKALKDKDEKSTLSKPVRAPEDQVPDNHDDNNNNE